tara:strand:- start:1554 stop:1703 length:150 start_codon:yes stop_codon:yes gene_type:complete
MIYLNIKGKGKPSELLKHYKHDVISELVMVKRSGEWFISGYVNDNNTDK